MNRYMMIHRLRGPAFLLLTGILALLAQAHIFSWSKSWPLYLILWGVILLAERAAMAGEGDGMQWTFHGFHQQSSAGIDATIGQQQATEQQAAGTADAPAPKWTDEGNNPQGGQS